jgi:hypothetical protein
MRTLVAIGVGPLAGLLIASCARGAGPAPADTAPDASPAADASSEPGNLLGNGKGPCTNLECQQVDCTGQGQGDTTVTGTVYDPAGLHPLYNVIVYVPNAPLEPMKEGASCDQCGAIASGQPLSVALTGPDGRFTLHHVPSGAWIPLVLQLGKWRRQITIPRVEQCQETRLEDPKAVRLPANRSEGDMPRIAIATGGCDPFECLLTKIGIDASEFTDVDNSPGRVHVFQGMGGSPLSADTPSATKIWASPHLTDYDMLINACECGEEPQEKPQAAIDNVVAYANAGGRVFNTHYQYYFLDPTKIQSIPPVASNPEWQGTADFTWEQSGTTSIPGFVDTSFPKGNAFASWLVSSGGSDVNGQFAIAEARYNVTKANPPSQRWVSNTNLGETGISGPALMHYTFNTPVGVPEKQQCGRVLYSDFHVVSEDDPQGGPVFPQECLPAPMTPQELALEFMFFDLSACVQPDTDPPRPPPVTQ